MGNNSEENIDNLIRKSSGLIIMNELGSKNLEVRELTREDLPEAVIPQMKITEGLEGLNLGIKELNIEIISNSINFLISSDKTNIYN